MIYGVVLFAIFSLIFSSPGLRGLVAGDLVLSPREEKIGVLFGHYMGAVAAVMFFLWLFKPLDLPFLYVGAGGLFFLLTLWLLYKMARILRRSE